MPHCTATARSTIESTIFFKLVPVFIDLKQGGSHGPLPCRRRFLILTQRCKRTAHALIVIWMRSKRWGWRGLREWVSLGETEKWVTGESHISQCTDLAYEVIIWPMTAINRDTESFYCRGLLPITLSCGTMLGWLAVTGLSAQSCCTERDEWRKRMMEGGEVGVDEEC